jgi:hypothetical protein
MAHLEAKILIDWRARLQDFQHACEASGPGEQAGRLREASHCFVEALRALRMPLPPLHSRAALEEMLAAGAYESAALGLLRQDAGLMLSRGTNGICFATVSVSGKAGDRSAVGDTIALAVLGAEASALLALAIHEPQI